MTHGVKKDRKAARLARRAKEARKAARRALGTKKRRKLNYNYPLKFEIEREERRKAEAP